MSPPHFFSITFMNFSSSASPVILRSAATVGTFGRISSKEGVLLRNFFATSIKMPVASTVAMLKYLSFSFFFY